MTNPTPILPLEYAEPERAPSRASRRLVRACHVLAILCCAVAWVFLVFWESVLLAGLMLFTIGLLLVVGGSVTRDWRAVVLGAAHVAVCVPFVAVVHWRGWSFREAGGPFMVMVAFYTLSALSIATWSPKRSPGRAGRSRVVRA